MAITSEEIQLRIVASGNAAKKELAELGQQQDDLKRKIEGLNKKSKDYASTKRKLQAELKQTNERMRKLRGEIDLNTMSMRDLRNRARDLKRVMDNMNPDSPEWKKLNGDLTKVNGRMRELRGSTSKLRGGWDKMVSGIKSGLLAFAGIEGIRRLWNGAANAVQDYIGQAQAIKKVEQAIISTNGAAGFSLSQLRAEASRLQEETLFGDEDILNNATAQLLTFTNIANDNFLRTQQVAMDLSTVLDGDLKSASIQLGKALNDPVANLSALSRSGIQFSAAQKEVIKDLANSNRLAEAQAVILDELERQYGGQAAAAVEAGGALKQLSNLWGDFAENLGGMFNTLINDWMPQLKNMVNFFLQLTDQKKASESVRQLNREFNIQMETLKRGNLSAENRRKLIEQINEKYKDYLPNLIDEKTSLEELKKAQDEANTAFNKKISMMAAEEALQDVRKRQIENEVAAMKLQKRLSREQMELEEAKEGSLQRAANSYQGVDHTLHAANQRIEQTKRLIKANAEETEKLTKEFDVVNEAAQKFGITLGETLEPNAENANKAIEKAKADIEGLRALMRDGERGGETTDTGDLNEEDFKKQIDDKAYLDGQLYELARTSEQLEIEAAQAYYNELNDLAIKYGGDSALIEQKRLEEIQQIKDRYRKNQAQAEEITLQQGLSNLSGALDQVQGLLSENAEAQRSFGLFKLAIDTATSISSAIAGATQAAAATGPGAPFTIAAYIASMVATVVASFVKAKKLISGADAPKFESGGVLSGPRHSAGGMAVVDEYGVKQAEVEGGEAVLPVSTTAANMPLISYMLQNPGKSVMPTPSVNIDTASLGASVSSAPTFANGGTMPQAPNYSSTSSVDNSAAALLPELQKLTAAVMMDKDRRAVVSIQQFTDKQEDLDVIRKFSDIRST